MKILFLSHRLPYPPDKGDKIRSYNILQHLVARHEVHVGALSDDLDDVSHASAIAAIVSQLYLERLGRFRRVWSMGAMFSGDSITARHFHSGRLQRRVDCAILKERFDWIICYTAPMAEYVFRSTSPLYGTRLLMDLVDVDSEKWRDYCRLSRGPMRFIYAREARELARLELKIAETFDQVLLTSEKEKRFFPFPTHASKVHAIPNGVDADYFREEPRVSGGSGPPQIVFTGVMDYYPNVDAVVWFATCVLPLIRKEVGDARFLIVGKSPATQVRRLAGIDGVSVTGAVPDVRPYLQAASVVVAPLRIARGIQNKILEAMAMSRPVVATTEAAAGIAAEIGEEILAADDAWSFASAVTSLLQNAALARKVATAGRMLVERRYSWSGNLARLDEMIEAGRHENRGE